MNEILIGLGLSEDVAMAIAIYGLVVVAAFWLALSAWAYRDMRARSRDGLLQIGAAALVAILTLPGLLIYLLLRPRETLSDAYERSLEEEALLQEIEEKPTCPGCGQRTQESWQVCPHCHTRLKKVCVHCRSLLDLAWQICPHCTAPQPGYVADIPNSASQTETRYSSQAARVSAGRGQTIEFVDGD